MRVKTYQLVVALALFLLAQVTGFASVREHGASSSSVSAVHKHALSGLAASHWSVQRGHRFAKAPSAPRCELSAATVAYEFAFHFASPAFAYTANTVEIFAETKLWLLFCSLLR